MQQGDIIDKGDFFEVGLGRDIKKDTAKGKILSLLLQHFKQAISLEAIVREANLSKAQKVLIQHYVNDINASSKKCYIEMIKKEDGRYYRMGDVEREWGTYGY